MEQSLGIVVPAFRPDVEALVEYVRELAERLEPATVRIELDDPRSRVEERLRAADLPPSATLSVARRRRGKGAAITAGFEALDTDLLLFVDADGSTPAESAERILEPIYAGRADVAVGSRRHPESTVTSHQTFARRRLGDGFAWLARRLLEAELYDYQCGAKALTAEWWDRVRGHLYESGFAWDIELVAMAAALGARVLEVPIEWEDHPGSTVSPVRTTLSLARALFVVRHRAERLGSSRLHDAIAEHRDETALVDRK
jgi:glycosyltransferase involved in cell wall biosynthesis